MISEECTINGAAVIRNCASTLKNVTRFLVIIVFFSLEVENKDVALSSNTKHHGSFQFLFVFGFF